MKLTPAVPLALLTLVFFLGLLPPVPALALDPGSSPVFAGSTLVVHGETYEWDEAASSEDAMYREDIYTSTTTSHTLTVYGMIAAPWLATVTGSGVDGHLDNGNYGDNSQGYTENGSFPMNGHTFTQHSVSVTYYPDIGSGSLNSNGSESYTGPGGSYTYWWDEMGNGGWSEDYHGDSQSANSSSSFELFGATYTWTSGTWASNSYSEYWGAGGSGSQWTDHFTSPDGGSMTIEFWEDSMYSSSSVNINGWDPYAGTFSAYSEWGSVDFGNLTWGGRGSASFAPNQLWVDGTLVNFTQGEIDQSGNVWDYYEDSTTDITLSISGNIRDFTLDGGTASVNGNGGGTLTQSGGFSDTTISTSPPVQSWTDDEPFFTSATSLWVDGTEYLFDEGYEDSTGSRTDTYVNASTGTVTLSGNTSNASYADVLVNHLGGTDSGFYSGGDDFTTYVYVVSIYSAYTPEAFWVRGVFYTRTAPGAATYAGPGGATLTLASPADGQVGISGTDATGTFTGSYQNSREGLFLLQDGLGAPLPAVPANTDGSLQLGGAAAPAGLPPAVMVVDGRIWTYLGTAADDLLPASDAAYYGSALEADESPWLLKIRLGGGGTVTYTDYTTAASATGAYHTTTHLFQTSAPSSGFPVPVYGVDPTSNNVLWGLPEAPAGLPATFLVGGQVWRHSGMDGTTALYQGYYAGQQLALAAADGNGLRVVTVADPLNGNSTGTLNDVRGSARLADGRVAYSGSSAGAQVNPTLNEAALHTINADLDITGNVVTFGALNQSTATAGVTLLFADLPGAGDSLTASLYNMLGRPQAQWVWARAADSGAEATLPVMRLDSTSKLTLYDPAGGGAAGVQLDAAEDGVSSLRGILRVRPGGDIGMGDFTAGGEP